MREHSGSPSVVGQLPLLLFSASPFHPPSLHHPSSSHILMTLLLPSRPDSRRSRRSVKAFHTSATPSPSFTSGTQCRLEVIPLTVQLPLIPVFSPPHSVGWHCSSFTAFARQCSFAHHHTALHACHLHSTAHLLLSVHYSLLRPALAAIAAQYLSFTLTRWQTHRHPV